MSNSKSKSRSRSNVAFVEEAADDDAGSSVGGRSETRIYAYSEEDPTSPTKELPNTARFRSTELSSSNSNSTARPAKISRESSHRDKEARNRKEMERREAEARRARAHAKADRDSANAINQARPQLPRNANTQPVIRQSTAHRRPPADGPNHYGVPQPAPSSSRPRANSRPASYHAQMGPPPPSPLWAPQSPMLPPPFPPGAPYPGLHIMTGGMPPGMPPGMSGGPPPPSPGGPPPGFYDRGPLTPQGIPRDLRQRFDPSRPSSAMGHNGVQSRNYYPDHSGYEDEPSRIQRRPSRSQRHQQDEDRRRMPPPDARQARNMGMHRRPNTAANVSTPFQPPPPQHPASRHTSSRPPPPAHRRSVGFVDQTVYDDEDALSDDDLFHASPDASHDRKWQSLNRGRLDSLVLDDDELDSRHHPGRGGRRSSTYGAAEMMGDGSRKYMDAMKYQEDVSGGPRVPLTAETLRRASRRGEGVASSRSTRSSGSHDDSEYKRSNTTGLTRLSSGNEEMTIKVTGAALVRLNGAEIECENSEITFSNGNTMRGGGSNLTDSGYELEDGRGRREHKALPHRPRAPSQADSQSRGYIPSHAPYDAGYSNFI